jgi:hypothetical protein
MFVDLYKRYCMMLRVYKYSTAAMRLALAKNTMSDDTNFDRARTTQKRGIDGETSPFRIRIRFSRDIVVISTRHLHEGSLAV